MEESSFGIGFFVLKHFNSILIQIDNAAFAKTFWTTSQHHEQIRETRPMKGPRTTEHPHIVKDLEGSYCTYIWPGFVSSDVSTDQSQHKPQES